MQNSSPFNNILIALIVLCFGTFTFYGGKILTTHYFQKIIASEEFEARKLVKSKDQKISQLNSQIEEKNQQIKSIRGTQSNLEGQINTLNSKVAGMAVEISPYPMDVPTVGFTGSDSGVYKGSSPISPHYGVDIWSNPFNGGAINTHKGNPVYAACDGVVYSMQPSNGGVTILCDRIPDFYNVPVHEGIKTYYGHMANALTHEQYIYLTKGQRVARGEFIGFQGDLSIFTPEMRTIHLHFSLFTGKYDNEGNLDPCLYIGGICTRSGEFFTNSI